MRDYLKKLLKDQPTPTPFIEKNRTKEGRIIDVQVDWNYKRDNKGRVVGFISVLTDISERKKAEEALEKSEEKYHNLIELANDAIVSISREGLIIGFNKKAEKMFGYSREEIIGKPSYLLVVQEHRENQKRILKHFAETGTSSFAENKITEGKGIRKEGKEFDVEFSYYVLDIQGELIATAIIRDISERKEAEEELLKSEGKYRAVVSNVGIGIALISPDMEILSLNNQMQQWFPEVNVSKKPICYKSFNNPSRESVCSYCPTFKTIKDGQVHESITDTPQGDKITNYRIVSSALKDNEGKIISAIEMVEDITEQRVTQERLLDYQKQLKTLTSQIILSEEKERKRFAGYLHDEIGQYLFASQMQLKLLKDSLASTKYAKTLDIILNNIGHMIVNARSLTFELSPPILYELGFEKALEWLAEQTHNNYGILVTFEDDKREQPLDDDVKIFLYQAVRELLANVAKHAQTKSASVSVKQDNSNIRICVEDKGVGFYPANENSYETKLGGIGLFRIKERLEQFGGQLIIESQPNRGTHITIVAPLSSSV